MKIIVSYFFLLLLSCSGCSKSGQQSNSAQQNNTVVKKEILLTKKIWRLASYGHDKNNNGIVDPFEESINNCEKDNTYSFALNGSGVMDEMAEICPGKIASGTFQWSFINGETGIDFIVGTATIIKLTEEIMVLGENTNTPGRLILFYEH